MLPPASSNRSKNSRSRGAKTEQAHGAGTLAMVAAGTGGSADVEALARSMPAWRALLPRRRARSRTARRAGQVVVCHAPVLDTAVVVQHARRRRAGRRRRACPTLPGLTSSVPPGPRALNGQVRVTEHQQRGVHPLQQLGARRARARAGSSARPSRASRGRTARRRRAWVSGSAAISSTTVAAQQLARSARWRPAAASGASSGAAVQRSPLPRIQRASRPRSRSTRLRRPGAEQRVVAAEHEALGPAARASSSTASSAGRLPCTS